MDLLGLGMSFQEPDNLTEPEEPVDSSFSLQLMSPTNPSYKEITIDFENSGLKVIKVEKLKNDHLCKRYLTERKLILDQRSKIDSGFKLNEKYLYHGTSVDKGFICEEGLDSRMSKQGCFGKGIYFSDYPKKCVKYAEKGDNAERFILLMRVILGESKIYPRGAKDRCLVREPEKSPPFKGYRFYDSVQLKSNEAFKAEVSFKIEVRFEFITICPDLSEALFSFLGAQAVIDPAEEYLSISARTCLWGCPVNHQEFVVYENRRALVEYIITYKKQEKASDNPKTKSSVLKTDRMTVIDAEESSSDSDSYTNSLGQDDSDTTTDEDDRGAAKLRPRIVKSIPKSFNFDGVDYGKLLSEKKADFTRLTGVTDENIIDLCLLRGNMELDEAVKLYKERGNGVKDLPLPDVPKEFEESLMKETERPSHPEPGTAEWSALDDEEKEAIIATYIEDFLYVTGLSEDDTEYAKKRLASSRNNLDLAIVAHYEDM